uniref:Uncharacterized protein n=1 Tax=viral metagenome TaxID=1070528 RepID=A0A6C0LQM1_9ZZZZ
MDYSKQLEYYNYVKNQKENYIDLTKGLESTNDSIYLLANRIFNQKLNNLDSNLSYIFIDDMEVADLFCALIELTLYGLNILIDGAQIFNLHDITDDIINVIKSYLKSTGFKMNINEIETDELNNLYGDNNDYYCRIMNKPQSFLHEHKNWVILDYHILVNPKFNFTSHTKLENFVAFFMNKDNKIFTITYNFLIRNI